MKKIFKNFRVCICKLTGHWFDPTEALIWKIKTNELNGDMTARIRCRCCGDTFVHKDSPEV